MRLHLFEFTDLDSVPDFMKFQIAELIELIDENSPTLETAMDKLMGVLAQNKERELTELAAGSGRTLIRSMAGNFEQGKLDKLVISDYYPQVDQYRQLAKKYPFVSYSEKSIDARHVPPDLKGARVIIRSFHHFKPEDAKAILKSAYDARSIIAIFETPERSARWIFFISLIPSFILSLIMTARIRPFRWYHLLFTYIIPIVPLMFCWDNVVSGLRAYTVPELKSMVADMNSADYQWDIGILPNKNPKHAIPRIYYLIGSPRKAT